MTAIILASSSKYRANLLSRLNIPFSCIAPNIDESPLIDEAPNELVKRLSVQKAKTVSKISDNAIVIGSDQVAVFNGKIIGKPDNFNNAFSQLKEFSGKQIEFLTGIAVINCKTQTLKYEPSVVKVKFRLLSDKEIKKYLRADQPYDCAGGFKVESLGIALFEYIESSDPTSLKGLPLITLCSMLKAEGISII